MQYRRDLSPLIKLLALGLFMLIGYQVWLKPAFAPPHSSLSLESTTVLQPASREVTLPEAQADQWLDLPESRLMDLGSAPNQKLEQIQEEIDRGHYNEAERRLRLLSRKTIRDITARRHIAGMWNNLGIQQEKFGGTALSVKAFQQSVAWAPNNPLAHLNLTQAYWELRDPAMTPQFLETVIRLAPEDPFPHLALADLLLSEGNTALAAIHLEHARPRVEHDANHQSYFRKLMAKAESIEPIRTARTAENAAAPPPPSSNLHIARLPAPQPTPSIPSRSASLEPPAKTQPAREESPKTMSTPQAAMSRAVHFTVQFDGPPDQTSWTKMQAILEYAHNELSQKFGHVPSKSIPVVLHSNQAFTNEAGSPIWADTLFDRSTGSIHLPTLGALDDLALFSRVARHQFAHALLFDYVNSRSNAVPTWLAEGLAIHLTEDAWPDLEETKPNAGRLIPLTSLEGEWKRLPVESLKIAYLESHLAVKNLVDRYSMYSVRQVVHTLHKGQTLDAAMVNKLSTSYEQFRRQWEKDLVGLAGQG